jgi:Tfp pilus assembly protein PilO
MASSDSNKNQLLVVGFVAAILAVIVLYFDFTIVRGQVNDFERRSERVEQEIADARAELKEIQALLDEEDVLESQRAMIEKVVRRLPSSPDAPGFLNSLVSVLRKTGLIQEGVRPDATSSFSQYTEIPYKINAHGRYHELGQFLTLVEQNPQRFMRVKNFKVINNLERPSIHPIDMQIATFMFNN